METHEHGGYEELLTADIELNLTTFESRMKEADATFKGFVAQFDEKKGDAGEGFVTAGEQVLVGAIDGIRAFAEKTLFESMLQVPKHEGVLMRSAQVSRPYRRGQYVKTTIGYGYGDELDYDKHPSGYTAAQYAVPVHEIGFAEHAPPTSSHFLVDPVLREAKYMQADMAIWIKMVTLGRVHYNMIHAGGGEVRYHIDFMGFPTYALVETHTGYMFRGGKPGNAGQFSGKIPTAWGPPKPPL